MTRKKKVLIVVTVVLLIAAAIFLLPRLLVYFSVKNLTMVDKPPAVYFTKYDADFSCETVKVENGLYSMEIPSDFTKTDKHSDKGVLCQRINGDFKENIFLSETAVASLNLSDPKIYEGADLPKSMSREKIVEWFEILGHGAPDSAYDTLRIISLLTRDDYSFLNLKKGTAFAATALMKEVEFSMENTYIYEREDICGFINMSDYADKETGAKGVYVIFEFFDTSDLDNSYIIALKTASEQDAYAAINSVKIIN